MRVTNSNFIRHTVSIITVNNEYLSCVCVLLTCFSHVRLSVTPWTVAHQAALPMGFPKQEYWSGSRFSSPGEEEIVLTQGLNLGHLHCRRILYHLSHQESPHEVLKTPDFHMQPNATLEVIGCSHTSVSGFPLHHINSPVCDLHYSNLLPLCPSRSFQTCFWVSFFGGQWRCLFK